MNNNIKWNLMFLLISSLFLIGCPNEPEEDDREDVPPPVSVVVPQLNADSAYNYVAQQVAFGPRTPNSKGHKACGKWLVKEFKELGLAVKEQNFTATAYNGTKLQSKNIIASYKPEQTTRVLLCAHWDTRHIADSDLATEKRDVPILGADDGGSGVGLLLEIARVLQENNDLDLGVDFVLFDAEDYGDPDSGSPNSWALGAQYWSRNVGNYKAHFGILLDMVGSKGARFTKEKLSMYHAQPVMDKTWAIAAELGYGGYFHDYQSSGVTDDHKFVNEIAKIPTIDIINKSGDNYTFGEHWHTHNDNMDIIDKNTLKAVGQTVLTVLYRKEAGRFL